MPHEKPVPTEREEREAYEPGVYEDALAQAGSFPEALEIALGEEARLPDGNLGFPTPPDAEPENEQDRLDRETAWHHLANPAKPITPRHWELCRLLAMGTPHYKIKEIMGYTQSYISVLSCHPKLREEVNRLQGVVFERTVEERFRQMNHKALDVVEEVIDGKDRDIKVQDRLRAATWLLEKTTGKAKQEIETKGGNLSDFMTLLREASEQQKVLFAVGGEAAKRDDPLVIDVTPSPEEKEKDSLAAWVDNNF